jgi:hypothetical protein
MKITNLQKLAIALLIVSFLVGAVGTLWSIYLSFDALERSENSGIGPVGDQIFNALLFSAGSILGSLIALVLLILGRPRT